MPNSLKCRLKKLKHQGLLSEKDLSRIYTDNDVTEELEKIKAEIEKLEYVDFDCNYVLPSDETIGIIQWHITELKLKGENK